MSAELAAYGHHKSASNGRARLCCCLSTLVVALVFVGFVLLGAVYLPYQDALAKHTKAYHRAESYVDTVCGNRDTMSQLGLVGEEDCVAHKLLLGEDIEDKASREVLDKINIFPDGVVMSFNLRTFITSFLPWTFLLLVVGTLALGGCIIHLAYKSSQRNSELPMLMLTAMAAQQRASHMMADRYAKPHTE